MVMQIKLVVVVVACALIVTDTCVKFDTRCSPENHCDFSDLLSSAVIQP